MPVPSQPVGASHRTDIYIADTVKTTYNHCYVMTEATKLTDAKTGAPLRKSGAFVVVADKYIAEPDRIGTVVAFFNSIISIIFGSIRKMVVFIIYDKAEFT